MKILFLFLIINLINFIFSTQATELVEIGSSAYNGDTTNQKKIILKLSEVAQVAYQNYGFPISILIAQVIQETGWVSFIGSNMKPEWNNVLGMNKELLNDQWQSPWDGNFVEVSVPQYVDGEIVYGVETMRVYPDMESCLNDYSAFKIGIHGPIPDNMSIDEIIDVYLKGYATDPEYFNSIRRLIEKFDLNSYNN